MAKDKLMPHKDSRPPEFPENWDSTMRSAWTLCHAKGYWTWLRRLTPIEISTDLLAGGAFAEGLKVMREAYYLGHYSEADALTEGCNALLTFYGPDHVPAEKNPKTAENMMLALESYAREYPLSKDIMQPHFGADGRPMIEFTFKIPIPGLFHPETGNPISWCGRSDMIAQRNGVLYVTDEKTTRQLGATWPNKWGLRGQFIGYCWAAREHNLPVVGALVRGIGILKHEITHAQALIDTPNWLIEKFVEQLQRDIKRALDAWNAGIFDQAFDEACTMYDGCDFKRLCMSPNPENWVTNFFVRNAWDPLAKDPEMGAPRQPAQRTA